MLRLGVNVLYVTAGTVCNYSQAADNECRDCNPGIPDIFPIPRDFEIKKLVRSQCEPLRNVINSLRTLTSLNVESV
jgi:hypothetical protein